MEDFVMKKIVRYGVDVDSSNSKYNISFMSADNLDNWRLLIGNCLSMMNLSIEDTKEVLNKLTYGQVNKMVILMDERFFTDNKHTLDYGYLTKTVDNTQLAKLNQMKPEEHQNYLKALIAIDERNLKDYQ